MQRPTRRTVVANASSCLASKPRIIGDASGRIFQRKLDHLCPGSFCCTLGNVTSSHQCVQKRVGMPLDTLGLIGKSERDADAALTSQDSGLQEIVEESLSAPIVAVAYWAMTARLDALRRQLCPFPIAGRQDPQRLVVAVPGRRPRCDLMLFRWNRVFR